MDDKWSILMILFPVCSFSGLAALLRSEQPLTRRAVASASLNSGLFGVAIGGLMIHKFGLDSLHIIIAISILAGLGGNASIDFANELWRAYVRGKK
jgi:hypothetical protein